MVNGVRHSVDADPTLPCCGAARSLGLRGTKFGCGIGAHGASTVHLGGEALRACITTLQDVADKQGTDDRGFQHAG